MCSWVLRLLFIKIHIHRRAALESSTLNYLLAHFHDGVASVFSGAGSNIFFVQIVANKYNPANYWYVVVHLGSSLRFISLLCSRSGRWRSEYVVDLNNNKLDGKILANVHYYEQGNVRQIVMTQLATKCNIVLQVQLATDHTLSILLASAVVTSSPASSASKILALIEDEEGKYQASLNDTYHEMGEKTFKGLRRALPMTRQKLDWDKASNQILTLIQ